MFNKLIRNTVASIFSITTAMSCLSANATIVEFQTSQGNIQVNLFDEATPKTVKNFLAYVNDGAYTNSVIHRSVSNFIIQGGGFTFNGTTGVAIPTKPSVINESVFSNVRGTIAMAKLSNNPNSATNQWFFNLNNNSSAPSHLDTENDGFTVFGQIIESDLDTLDTLAAINMCNKSANNELGSAFVAVPLVDYNCSSSESVALENLILINQIIIIDSSSVTANNLTPVKNTLINQPNSTPKSDSGGGSIYWILMMLFTSLVYRKSPRLS